MTLLEPKEIELLLRSSFELQCLDLRVESIPTGPLQGAGRIHQPKTGDLGVTAYFPGGTLRGVADGGWEEPGILIPEGSYATLEARDMYSKRWTCERFIPQFTVTAAGLILDGPLPFLRGHDQLPRAGPDSDFRGHLFQALHLPMNRVTRTRTQRGRYEGFASALDVAEFEAAGFEFHVTEDEGHVTVFARREAGPLPRRFGARVLEALRFVTAELLDWDATVECDGRTVEGLVVGRKNPWGPPRLPRPLPTGVLLDANGGADTWRLFARYLEYILAEDRDWGMHPLSRELSLALQGSTGTLETQATLEAVVVEGLCRLLVEHGPGLGIVLDNAPGNEAAHWAARVEEAAASANVPERLRLRIAGFLRSIQQGRPTDVLYHLVREGRLRAELVSAWEKLRHSFVHADREGDVKELLKRCDCVTTLLYELCFLAVGYEGVRMDFSGDGWCVARYPSGTTGQSVV